MSYHRARFWYQGAENIHFGLYDGFIVDFPTGVGQLDASRSTLRNPDGIGVSCQLETVPERNISINGYVMGSPCEAYRRMLERVFAPLSTGKLWAETEGGELFFLDCISTGSPVIEGVRNKPRFQVALVAEYPYWQRDTIQELSFAMEGAVREFQREIISDVPALFELEITASAGFQGAALVIGDQDLRYNGAILAGQTLSVRVDGYGLVSCMLGGADVIGNLSGGLKKLPAGMQTIKLEAPGNSGTVTAKIKYREARAGV